MKEYCVKEALVCWLVFYMVLGMPAQIAMAVVVLDNTAAGTITVDPLVGGIQDMTATNGAIGNFSDFDIALGHTVTCDQGGAGNSALFRVTGNGTEIYGKFEADGTIFLIDQAGILFGNDAVINVNQLVASSLNIADQDFANGAPFSFTGGSLEGTGDVTNKGTITAEEIALIGRIVENTGTLDAENYVILAAGDTVIISQGFDGAVSVEVSMPEADISDYVVRHNKGGIDAQHVILAAGDIWANAYINAYDEANSDAVASVTIDAMGDVTVTDEVKADTDAEDGQDNATSTVTVEAGNLTIEEGGRIEAYAYTYDGSGDATAIVDIDVTGDVYIEAEGSCDTVEAQAEALRGSDDNAPSGSAVASTSIDAGGSIDIYDAGVKAFASAKGTETGTSTADVHIATTGENGGDVYVSSDSKVHAKATTRYNGVDTPTGILSDADVEIQSEQDVVINGMVKSKANTQLCDDEDGELNILGNTQADLTLKAAGDVLINQSETKDSQEAIVMAHSHGGDENNASILVDAGGDVTVNDGDEEDDDCLREGAEIFAHANNGNTNNARIDVIARGVDDESEGNVSVEGQIRTLAHSCDKDEEMRLAYNAQTNVTAAGDVLLDNGAIVAEASNVKDDGVGYSALEHNATVNIDAGGHVVVCAEGEDGEAEIAAYAEYATLSNTASVDITANNVLAAAGDGADARIKARAAYTYAYEEPKDDLVAQVNGEVPESDGTSNTANVTIHAFKVEIEEPAEEPSEPDGLVLASALQSGGLEEILADYIDGGHVAAVAYNGGDAQIEAVTFGGEGSDPVNTSDVLICAEGIVAAGALDCRESDTNAEIKALSHFGFENNSNVGIGAQQGVGVLAMGWGASASISSDAMYGYTDTADLVVCTGGPLAVLAMNNAEAAIESGAFYGQTDSAYTGVRADSLIVVGAANYGDAIITSEAGTQEQNGSVLRASLNGFYEPPTATAETVVVSRDSGVVVAAMEEGYADISSSANAYFSDAYTGVCAQDHVIVAAGTEDYVDDYFGDFFGGGDSKRLQSIGGSGGEAYIRSEAGSSYLTATSVQAIDIQQEPVEYEPSTANAETAVVSHEGSVLVADATSWDQAGNAAIESEAHSYGTNTAYTGVAAGADLSPGALDDEIPSEEPEDIIEYLEQMYRYALEPGNVYVEADGPYSNAKIHSYAHSGLENTADTVVCAPGTVYIEAEGKRSLAKIKACAEWGEINTATTRVYASEVDMYVPGLYRGNGIWAWADGVDTNPRVPAEFVMTEYDDEYGTGEFVWAATESEGDSSSTVIVQDYSLRQDCPDCPPEPECPDCGDEELLAPVAPLAQFEIPRVEGCPAVMLATAAELGIPAETLQVAIGNSQATNPNIQPCQACSTLISAANMLKNEGDMRMAAMVQAFNTLAPADAPFTPELSASVATAFATAEEGSIYASAAEYIDAMVQYVAVLDTDLGSPVGDSVAYAMEKYGTQIVGSDNANLTAFVTARIETLSTFAQ